MTDATILDLAAIAEAKATMKAKFPTIVQYFLEDSETYIGSIRAGIVAASAEQIISPAHTLKSSSRLMGAMRVSDIAKAMEALAREQVASGKNDMQPFSAMLPELETACGEACAALKQQAA
jgi:HPt (histidine-containing phosphotransfer) domain-containing protein